MAASASRRDAGPCSLVEMQLARSVTLCFRQTDSFVLNLAVSGRDAVTVQPVLSQPAEIAPAEPQMPDPSDSCSNECSWQHLTEAELRDYLGQLFLIGDANGDGTLQREEFGTLLGLSGLGFDGRLVEQVWALC